MSRAYRCLSWALALPLRAFALLRFAYHHMPAERAKELWGQPTRERPDGYLLWIHAVDIGEMRLALTLVRAIFARHADIRVLITSMTSDSQQFFQGAIEDSRIFHQYTPLDRSPWAERFLKHWRPDLAIRIEAEFWPNTLRETAKVCRLVLVQGRMSERSFRIWHAMPRFAESTMSRFTLALCQNPESAEHLSKLGAARVRCLGNLKLANLPHSTPVPPPLKDALVDQRPLWIAVSTYPREEQAVFHAQQRLGAQSPRALCVLAPRLVARGAAAAAAAERFGLRSALRSRQQPCGEDCSVYVLDSLGELDSLYPNARAAFVGGSLVPKGSHNLLEPALHGCIVLHGPHTRNAREAAQILQDRGSGLCVRSNEELAVNLIEAMEKRSLIRKARRTRNFLLSERNQTLERVLQNLSPYLPPP